MKFLELIKTIKSGNPKTRVVVTSNDYLVVGGRIVKKGQFVAFSADEEEKVNELGEKVVLSVTSDGLGIINVTL